MYNKDSLNKVETPVQDVSRNKSGIMMKKNQKSLASPGAEHLTPIREAA